jgi:hypothetical protein
VWSTCTVIEYGAAVSGLSSLVTEPSCLTSSRENVFVPFQASWAAAWRPTGSGAGAER